MKVLHANAVYLQRSGTMLLLTHIPPSNDRVCIEVLGNPSELVLGSGVVSSHGGLLLVLSQKYQ